MFYLFIFEFASVIFCVDIFNSLCPVLKINGDRHLTVTARDKGTPSLESNVTVVVKTRLVYPARYQKLSYKQQYFIVVIHVLKTR